MSPGSAAARTATPIPKTPATCTSHRYAAPLPHRLDLVVVPDRAEGLWGVTAQGERSGVTCDQLAPVFERETGLYAGLLGIARMSAFSHRVLRATAKTAYPFTHIRIFVEEYPMSLYIRDPDVAALAAKLQDLTGSRTKTEAVRLALQQAIERANAKRSFAQRNAHVLEMADALGSTNPEFDCKAFFDQMWGDV